MPTDVIAASGDSILAHVQNTYRLSTDFGKTWTDVDPGLDDSYARPADYVEDGWAAVNDWDAVVRIDLATGEGHRVPLAPLALAEGDNEPIVTTSDRDTLLWDGTALVISRITDEAFGTPAAAITQGLPAPAGVMYPSVEWSIDHAFAYRSIAYTNARGAVFATDIDPIGLDGDAGPAPFRAKGDVLHVDALDATHLEYFTHTTTAVNRCVRDLTTGTSTCKKLRKSTASRYPLLVQRQGDVVLLQDRNSWSSCRLSGTACVFGTIAVPKGTVLSTQYHAVGDPTLPLLGVAGSGPSPVYSLGAGRVLARLFDPLVVPVIARDLSFGVDRLAGRDHRATRGVWQRSLDSDGIGVEKVLAASADSVWASAGRTAVDTGAAVSFYDRAKLAATGSPVQRVLGFSGPYPLVDRGSGWFDLNGYVGVPLGNYRKVDTYVRAIFGTRLLGGTDCWSSTLCEAGGPVTSLVITDIVDAGYRREIPLPEGVDPSLSHVLAGYLWGDRVAVTFMSLTAQAPEQQLLSAVYDLGAGTWTDLQPGTTLLGLGDGYALRDDGSGYAAWDFRSDATYPLADAEKADVPVLTAGAAAVAYATNDELVIRRVPGAGQSAPRVLGVVAPPGCNSWDCSWTPQIDATKALDAGRLVIRTEQGDVVRTLQTPAAPDGSIRGVTWDGRLEDGSFASAGAYTWQLEAAATDGTGSAKAVDGSSVPGGAITVSQTHLGKARVTKVAISPSTPKVEQKLTSTVVVFPKDASLTYTWYAGSKVVSTGTGADFASYTVTALDVGRKLKLAVSAQREGTYPGSRTSATTKATARARFTDTKKPTLTLTGNVVSAAVSAWTPTATLSYQWYRVAGTKLVKIGANEPAYTLTSLDNGFALKLVVTGSRTGFYPATTTATTDVLTFTP